VYGSAQSDPVQRLRCRGEQPLAWQGLQRVGVLALQRLEQAAIELFVDDEVTSELWTLTLMSRFRV
jgi:hypothetical protein